MGTDLLRPGHLGRSDEQKKVSTTAVGLSDPPLKTSPLAQVGKNSDKSDERKEKV